VTARRVDTVRTPGWTVGLGLASLLAVVVLLGAWFFVLDRGPRPSVTVNDHTDDSVPMVDRQAPRLSAFA
jgi:hypothetical protein